MLKRLRLALAAEETLSDSDEVADGRRPSLEAAEAAVVAAEAGL